MDYVKEILRAGPKPPFVEADALAACIEACAVCAQACVACADACLGEQNVIALRRCIRLNHDCAELCEATGHILTRQQGAEHEVIRGSLKLLARMCRICGDECERHAEEHEHCRVCMEACRECERSCYELLRALGGEVGEEAVAPH